MGTRSTIWIKEQENEKEYYEGIYCHWDGYLEYNGKILYENYNNEEKVKELINLGDISSLAENINPKEGEIHNFENKQENVVVAYHRDRGEQKHIFKKFNLNDLEQEEFNYLYQDNEWYLIKNGELNLLKTLLEQELGKELEI